MQQVSLGRVIITRAKYVFNCNHSNPALCDFTLTSTLGTVILQNRTQKYQVAFLKLWVCMKEIWDLNVGGNLSSFTTALFFLDLGFPLFLDTHQDEYLSEAHKGGQLEFKQGSVDAT